MKRSARSASIEPLGVVLRRDTDLRVPGSVEVSPIAFRDWEAAVGSRIAARARPVRLDRGVLVVRTATSTRAQELALLADAIVFQLRGRGITVSSLRFRVGPVDAPERPPNRDELHYSPRAVALPDAVRAEIERVADPELRAVIALAAAKNLGWQAAVSGAEDTPAPAQATSTRRLRKARVAHDGAALPRATSAPSGARGPRFAGTRSAPPARTTGPGSGARRGKP
jgi:hypothetical protein